MLEEGNVKTLLATLVRILLLVHFQKKCALVGRIRKKTAREPLEIGEGERLKSVPARELRSSEFPKLQQNSPLPSKQPKWYFLR